MSQTQSQPQTTGEKLARSALEEVRELREEVEELREENQELKKEKKILKSRVDGLDKATDGQDDALAELQSRELEKGAHLKYENVERRTEDLEVSAEKLQRFENEDGETYVRIGSSQDPLERSGDSDLAQGDLLPIQQLAMLDDDMLDNTVNAFPTKLAAEAWDAMTEDYNNPWSKGGASIEKYLMSSDLKSWIRRNHDGISEDYAAKLAQRTMDAIVELTSNRVYTENKTQRKNGLEYTESRVILPSDADIPGQMSSSVTGDNE